MINGNLIPFVDEILDYHKCKTLRSYREYNENAFHSAVEVLLRSFSISYISELQIITKFKEKYESNKITFGFADLFIFDSRGYDSIVFELKLFNLIGLYSGKMNKWEDHPEHNSLIEFDKNIREEPEETLLDRNYIYWCKNERISKKIKVRSVIEKGYEQLCDYIKVIKNGKVYNRVGISDNRLTAENGCSHIRGYLIASFGTQRVIVRSLVKNLNYQFFKTS